MAACTRYLLFHCFLPIFTALKHVKTAFFEGTIARFLLNISSFLSELSVCLYSLLGGATPTGRLCSEKYPCLQTGSALSCQQYLCGGARLASTPESSLPPPRFFSQCLQQACFPPLPSLSSHTAGRAVRRGLKKIFVGGGRKERGGKKGIEELSRKVSAVKYHFLLPYCVFQEPMMYDTLKQNVQQ